MDFMITELYFKTESKCDNNRSIMKESHYASFKLSLEVI